MLRGFLIIFCSVFLCTISFSSEEQAPLFLIDFGKGVTADVRSAEGWEEKEGNWTGKNPPGYYDMGLSGKALIVGDTDGSGQCPALSFPEIIGQGESGTVLFWIRGIEGWDLWRSEREGGLTTQIWRGLGATINRHPRHQPRNIRMHWLKDGKINIMTFPNAFDKYRWMQIGYSWQSGFVSLYLNGELISSSPDFHIDPVGGGFTIGGGLADAGSRRLYDNIKVWDSALSASEVKRVYRRDMQLLTRPLVSAGYLNEPPGIDGIVNTGEWKGASQTTGMLESETGEVSIDQSRFFIGYDSQYLYIAMQGGMTELALNDPEMVMQTYLKSEGAPDTDDLVEVLVSPSYWSYDINTLGYWKTGYSIMEKDAEAKAFFMREHLGDWDEYRLAANSGGLVWDAVYRAEGIEEDWSSGCETASTVSNEGWQFEARVPLKAFGGVPESGEEWGFQLARIWKHLKQQDDVWAWGQNLEDGVERHTHGRDAHGNKRGSMGVLRLGARQEPVIKVLSTGDLGANRIDWHASIYNPADTGIEITARLFTDTPGFSEEERLRIPAGGRAEFMRKHHIENYASSTVTFEVWSGNKEILHRTHVPFYLEQSFGVRIEQWPNYEKFFMELDLGIMAHIPADELKLDIDIRDGEGETAYSEQDRSIPSHVSRLEYASEGIVPGDYTLVATVRRGDKVKAVEEKPFAKIGKAEWWDNRYGLEDIDRDRVPYPWTNMEVMENAINVWGRRYDLGASFLPRQITTLDYPMLRSPMRIVVRTADGEVMDTSRSDAAIEWKKKKLTRVEGSGKVEGKGFSLRNDFWAEYDGLLWNTVTLIPKSPIIDIASMELEIPLTREFTDVINIMTYGLRGTGKLKDEGYLSSPTRAVWLGNGDGGIQWYCETDGWFFVKDADESLRVEMQDGQATLRIIMIDLPTDFKEPHEIQFGFMATPARPKTWRTPEHSRYGGVRGAMFNHPQHPLSQFESGLENGRLGLYVSTDRLGSGEDLDKYSYEWRRSPYAGKAATTASESYRYYLAWRHWRRQHLVVCGDRAGNCRGFVNLYYDCSHPGSGTNEYLGQGYKRRDGTTAPTNHLLAHRDVTRRLYNIAMSNPESHPRDSWIGYHSTMFGMVFESFANGKWTAENLNSVIGERQQTYLDLVDPAVYRATYLGHNFGWPAFFLRQGRIRRDWVEANGGPEAVFDHISGLDLLHDGGGVCCIMPAIEGTRPGEMRRVRERLDNAIGKHDFNHWIYQFTPYWKQDIIRLPRDNMYASFYIARPSEFCASFKTYDKDRRSDSWRKRAFAERTALYFDRKLPSTTSNLINIARYNASEVLKLREAIEQMQDKAIIIFYNDSEWEGEMRVKVDWNKLGLGSPDTLTAENAVHSSGFNLKKKTDDSGAEYEEAEFFPRPEEYANIENGELIFPMTGYNYRMIVIERKQ